MMRLLRADYLIPLILLAGMSQYAVVAIGVTLSGGASLWQLESDVLAGAGPLRYVKDIFVLCLSLAWVIALPRLGLPQNTIRLVKVYFYWLIGVVFIGSLGFVLDYSPILFLFAGMRWLLLLHASFGVFLLSSTLVTLQNRHRFIFRLLWVFLLVDAYAVMLQLEVASLMDIAFGAGRLTGLFSNAGAAAFFAISIALISFHLDGVALKKRMVLTTSCIFIALSSGTRFATTAVFLILLIQFWELAETRTGQMKSIVKLMFVPAFILALVFGYQALIQQVDRGDAISQQFDKGGRVGNMLETVDMLYSADFVELMVGRGLGLGTNTAYTSLYLDGVAPEKYRFNILTDNVILPFIFQFGIVGTLLFWVVIIRFILLIKPKYSKLAKYRYLGTVMVILLTFIAGSPFEHYFLMMSYALSFGAVYWSDRLAYKINLVRS